MLDPYEIVRTGLQPLGMNAGDFDLVVAPTDGKAYYYFERVHSELICADLTDDYTDVTGYYSRHFPRPAPPPPTSDPRASGLIGCSPLLWSQAADANRTCWEGARIARP